VGDTIRRHAAEFNLQARNAFPGIQVDGIISPCSFHGARVGSVTRRANRVWRLERGPCWKKPPLVHPTRTFGKFLAKWFSDGDPGTGE